MPDPLGDRRTNMGNGSITHDSARSRNRPMSLSGLISRVLPRHEHHTSRIPGTERGGSRRHHKMGQVPEVPQQSPVVELSKLPSPEPSGSMRTSQPQPKRSRSMTRDEIRTMLQAKEAARKQRRELKESGDWLGVQGADPYSGEFAVLTPTDTLSSDTPSPSIMKRLAELSWRQKTAKIAYEDAKLEEKKEKEKFLSQKGKSKLQKMEHAKEKIRQQQQGFSTWNRRRRRWSSAAEPELSPIPQPIKDHKLEGNLYDAAAAAICDSLRTTKTIGEPVVDRLMTPKKSGNPENTDPPRRIRNKNRSTETIIHKTLANVEIPRLSRINAKILLPSVHSDASGSSSVEEYKEKSFLWRRRRRMTDPGKVGSQLNLLFTNSSAAKTEQNLIVNTTEAPPPLPPLPRGKESKDHFSGLLIPDHCLSLATHPALAVSVEKSLTPAEESWRVNNTVRPTQKSHREAQSTLALKLVSKPMDCRESVSSLIHPLLDTEGATVTSSLLSTKGNMKTPFINQRKIPTRSSSCQKLHLKGQTPQIQTYNANQTRDHLCPDPVHTANSNENRFQQSMRQEESITKISSGDTRTIMNTYPKRDLEESASIPTTITIGSDLDLQVPLEDVLSQIGFSANTRRSTGRDFILTKASLPRGQNVLYNEPTIEREVSPMTSSHPIKQQSSSESFVLAHETLETDTSSTGLVKLESRPTSPVQRAHKDGCVQGLTSIPRQRAIGKATRKVEGANVPMPSWKDDTGNREKLTAKMNGLSQDRCGPEARINQQQRSSHDLEEIMILEAARIATLKSRARKTATLRSHAHLHTSSPQTRDVRQMKSSISQPKKNEGDSGGDVDLHSTKDQSTDVHRPPQCQTQGLQCRGSPGCVKAQYDEKKEHVGEKRKKSSEDEAYAEDDSPDTVILFASAVVMICQFLIGLLWAWWIVAKPAFDQESEVWRRRRGREATRGDAGVFTAAGMLCLFAASLLAGGVRIVFRDWLQT